MVVGPWVEPQLHGGCRSGRQQGASTVIENATLRRVGKATLAWASPAIRELRDELEITHLPTPFQRRTVMPALLIPVLWVGGAVVLLGGGYYIVQAMH